MIFSKALLMTSGKKQYTLTVVLSPGDATCTLTYNGLAHYATSATVDSGTVISYSISKSPFTPDATGTITMDANKTLTCTGTTGTSYSDVPFTPPILTANGTIGGNAFAVYASSENSPKNYGAWRCFDDASTTYYWQSALTSPVYYTIYNPTPIKISNIHLKNRSSSRRGWTSGSVQGSNDNSNWTNILSSWTNSAVTAGAEWDIAANSSVNYKYNRITFSSYVSGSGLGYPGIIQMTLTSTYQTSTTTYYWTVIVS